MAHVLRWILRLVVLPPCDAKIRVCGDTKQAVMPVLLFKFFILYEVGIMMMKLQTMLAGLTVGATLVSGMAFSGNGGGYNR